MDLVTHALSGLAIGAVGAAYGGSPREQLPLMLIGAAAALMPDLDALVGLRSKLAAWRHHRVLLHGMPTLPLQGLALYLLAQALHAEPLPPGVLALTIAGGLLAHLLLDTVTSFGTVLGYPFTRRRFSTHSHFIIDPVVLGSLAGAGTLGIMIPPSIIMIVYGVAANVSIARLFIAGILPGLLLVLLFMGCIMLHAWTNPQAIPPADPPTTFMEKIRLSGNLIPCGALIVFICWVLIAGYATATECAAYGVVGALALAAWSRSLTWANFKEGLMGTARSSCMIMFILAGAAFLTKTMAFTGIPRELAEWVNAMQLSPMALIAVLTVIYLILGTALDGISMIVLTSAVVLPMIQKAGFDLIWFGIFIVLLVEIAEVTPPVGFNLFVLQNMTGKDSNTIARAAIPFFLCLVVCIVLVTLFPSIVTFLPDMVMGENK
jgi:tripartite ATP-independent transporter DctM subunit